jgi:photosystem II stability/assembly factor-like uncharacterized protein
LGWPDAGPPAPRPGRATSGSASSATATPSGLAGAGSGARLRDLLHGKYQALEIAFPGRDTGFTAISGYAGASSTLRSWIERTADGGASWTASRMASGEHQPGAQTGMAFVSARQGWAYEPGLFFTRDGGATWRAERTTFRVTGPVSVAGTSTWAVGYACVRGDCPAVLYATDRVGGTFHRLAHQPTATGSVVALQRPTSSVASLVLAVPHGRLRLVTTSDAGRSWATRPLPRPGGVQLSAAGQRSLWLISYGNAIGPALSGVLYRSTDSGRTWARIGRENGLIVYAVSSRVAWAVQNTQLPNNPANILRTTDGGHTWHTVLTRVNTDVEAFVAQGPDGAQAIAAVFTRDGSRFVAFSTRNAGTTWHHATLPA